MSRTCIHIHIQMLELQAGQRRQQGKFKVAACQRHIFASKEKVITPWRGAFLWPLRKSSQAAIHGGQSPVERLLGVKHFAERGKIKTDALLE